MNNIVSRLSYIFRRNNKEKIEIIESHMDEQVKEESIAVQINLPSEPGDEMPYSLLVVEDNQDLLALMTKVFSRVYNLYIARDGEEGLKVLENNKIDVIVSDIMMPGMDGLEFCRILKSDSHTADIPIVLLTAKVDEEDFVKGYDSGADGYITKPFSFAVLQAKIKNLINTHQRVIKESSENLIFGINKEAIPKPEKYDEVFLQKAIAFIQNHVNDAQFSHQQFIREMGVSKSTLYKKLKTLTGLNTSAFIMRVRLKMGYNILKENPLLRVSDLAYSIGFNDPKYFSICFKKEFGFPPNRFPEKINATPEVFPDIFG